MGKRVLSEGLFQLVRREARRPLNWYLKQLAGSTVTPSPVTSTTTATTTTFVLSSVDDSGVDSVSNQWDNELVHPRRSNGSSNNEMNISEMLLQFDDLVGRVGDNETVNSNFERCWSSLNCSSANLDIRWDFNLSDYGGVHNGSFSSDADSVELIFTLATAFILALIILATVIGNVFVIAAILLERNLQNVANYLILSLAVADLLVACLVMPLGAVYEVSRQWTLGPELCDMWTSSDVLCCTASILHLVAIALDRYWAVTNIDYIHQRTAKRIGIMILVIWCVSFLVCIAPLLGWKDPEWETRVLKHRTCLVSQDIGYQIFATASSFYLPLFVILILYWRIFQAARKRIRRRVQASAAATISSHGTVKYPPSGGVVAGLCAAGATGGNGGIAAAVIGVIGQPLPTISELTTTTTTAMTNVSSANSSPEKGSFGNGLDAEEDPPTINGPSMPSVSASSKNQQQQQQQQPLKRKSKESADSKRERKAAKTLAIITGAFVICWLPFFIMAILLPICSRYKCQLNQYLIAFFLWLGYFNSTLNPIIYTIFSPEFRHAFKRILCGRKNSIRRRNRHLGIRHFH